MEALLLWISACLQEAFLDCAVLSRSMTAGHCLLSLSVLRSCPAVQELPTPLTPAHRPSPSTVRAPFPVDQV